MPLMALTLGVALHAERPEPASFLLGWDQSIQEKSPYLAPLRSNFPPSVWNESLTIGRLIALQADPQEWPADRIQDLSLHIAMKSREYRVSPLLVLSLIHVESRFRPRAVSPKGAIGLMQLMPATAQELAVHLGVDWNPENLTDPKTNIDLALNYITQLRADFDSDEHLLTAYNIGPNALRRKLRNGDQLPLGYYQKEMDTVAVYRQSPGLPKKFKGQKLWL
jgi:soluble lytic murein transglycosylase-like protein